MRATRFSFLDGDRDSSAGRNRVGVGLRLGARGSSDSLWALGGVASDRHGALLPDDAVAPVSSARRLPHGGSLRLEAAGGNGDHKAAQPDDGGSDRQFANV